jgi:hypothetical protein
LTAFFAGAFAFTARALGPAFFAGADFLEGAFFLIAMAISLNLFAGKLFS